MHFIFVSYSPRYTYCWYSCALRFLFDIHVLPGRPWTGQRVAGRPPSRMLKRWPRADSIGYFLPPCLLPRSQGSWDWCLPASLSMQKVLRSLGGTADSRQSDGCVCVLPLVRWGQGSKHSSDRIQLLLRLLSFAIVIATN